MLDEPAYKKLDKAVPIKDVFVYINHKGDTLTLKNNLNRAR